MKKLFLATLCMLAFATFCLAQGKPIPNVWASSLWVNRKRKWMAFSHQETDVSTP
jgi:hypothetical protein